MPDGVLGLGDDFVSLRLADAQRLGAHDLDVLDAGRGAEQTPRERVALLGLRRRAGRDADQQERLLDRRDLVFGPSVRIAMPSRAGSHDAEFRQLADLVRQHREPFALGNLLAHRERLERVAHHRVGDGRARSPRSSAPTRPRSRRPGWRPSPPRGASRRPTPAGPTTKNPWPSLKVSGSRSCTVMPRAFSASSVKLFSDVGVGFVRQLGQQDRGARLRVLEAGKLGARREAGRRDQSDARIEREHRVGGVRGRAQHQAGETCEHETPHPSWQCDACNDPSWRPVGKSRLSAADIHGRNMGDNAAVATGLLIAMRLL